MTAQLSPYLRQEIRRAVGFLLALALTSLGAFAQSGLKADRASAEHFTKSLMALNAQYQTAPSDGKAALFLQLRSVAAQRQQLLSSLIQTSPGEVLRVAIPGGIAATLPAFVQSLVEQETDAQGELEVIVEDGKTVATLHHYLKTGSLRLELKFAADAPTNLLTGTTVHVHGTRIGNTLALASGSPNTTSTSTSSFQVVSNASAPSSSGAVSTLVILVNFQDNPAAQPWTPSAVQNVVFSQTSNWDLENSFQQTWLTGDVAGWFTIPVNSTNCDTGTIKSDALSAAQAAGYVPSNYAHYIYLMSSNTGCSAWWGYASIGGSDVWVNGEYNIAVHVFAHEMGHNFGLYHAHTVDCGTAVTCSNGTLAEYGDGYDLMGASTYNAPHYNAFHKEQLGWLNNGAQPPITTVTASGTFDISPYEAQDGNPKALKILQSGSSNSYYYLEFRQALGFDSFLSSYSDIMDGTLFHLASPSNANSSDLLDLTPSSPSSFSHPALVAGQSYTDSTAGVTITPTVVNSTGATVQVTLGTGVCTLANPTVSVSPTQSQWVLSGSTVDFSVTVKDNDSPACTQSTFNLSDTLPSGWTGVWNPSALTLSPGNSGSATLAVTSPSGTPDGFYNVGVTATNAAAPSYSGSASATYVISTPATISISVSTSPSIASPGQTVTINVTVLSGTSPDVGASVTVTVTPPSGRAQTMTGTTGSNGVASLSYKVNKHAAAGTYQVQASTTSTGNGAAPVASTTFTVQ